MPHPSARRLPRLAGPGLLVLAGLGCATTDQRDAAPLIPSRSATQTGPFRIWTHDPLPADDPTPAQLRALQQRVEAELALRHDPQRDPIDIYILRDRAAFEHFLTFYYPDLPTRRAFFLAKGDRRVVYSYRGPHLVEDLRHEATHALLHASSADLPLWLDEGLAEYFEVPDDRGGLNAEHLSRVAADRAAGWSPDLARLEAIQDVRQMTPRDYRESWAWVHYLLNGPRPNRTTLLEYLADQRESPDATTLSRRLEPGDEPPPDRLLAYLELVRERPIAATTRPRPAYVVRGQDPSPDPAPIRDRRRGLVGRFFGLFGL